MPNFVREIEVITSTGKTDAVTQALYTLLHISSEPADEVRLTVRLKSARRFRPYQFHIPKGGGSQKKSAHLQLAHGATLLFEDELSNGNGVVTFHHWSGQRTFQLEKGVRRQEVSW